MINIGPCVPRNFSQQNHNVEEEIDGGYRLVVPGVPICEGQGFLRGHGTFLDNETVKAAVAGTVHQVSKLVSVKPVKSRYVGEVGDVVIGRITSVQQRRWKVDTNSRLDSALLLSSINLRGGELRRKSAEDEMAMREYLKEGDLISAEVQTTFHDGSLSLHTRNLRYGKLPQGVLVQAPAYLVKRRKQHFHTLPCGVSVIIGCNGNIFVSQLPSEAHGNSGGYVQNLEEVIPSNHRLDIVKVANCIKVLAQNAVPLFETSIIKAYEASTDYEPKELLRPDIANEIVRDVLIALQTEEY
uniref:Ribosomal RNA-processing protein 4 n=1 Tax=Steinernema glaseri TaxID=37863 RepID=A0A1I7YN80_9BILA